MSTATVTPTKRHARKVVELLSHGLVKGLGEPEPGKACVEAIVCLALGLPHGDNPPCVGSAVRAFKISLNDSNWSSNAARALGMRRVAVAQLGSNTLDQVEFAKRLVIETVRKIVPAALRAAAGMKGNAKHAAELIKCALACEGVESLDAARAASYFARAARAARAASDASDAASAARDAARAASAASDAASAASDAASAASYAANYAARAARAARYAANYAASAANYAASAASYAANYAARAARAARCAASAANYAASAASDAARAASYAARAASYAARAASDKMLSLIAECAVSVLTKMESPGCRWLDLCPLP